MVSAELQIRLYHTDKPTNMTVVCRLRSEEADFSFQSLLKYSNLSKEALRTRRKLRPALADGDVLS